MKQYTISSGAVFGLHKILFCITSPIDYEMERIFILEGDKYDEYIMVEGSHCSCFDFDESIWDATLFESSEELIKVLKENHWGNRREIYNYMKYYLNIKEPNNDKEKM